MAKIVLENVEKKYSNGPLAVRGLNLETADGELLVLVGPSGCGKSTTLRLVAGLESPTRGRIIINDQDVTAVPPHRRDLAMMFQNYALYPHMTVRGNLEFGLRMRKTSRDVITARVVEVAGILGLEPILDRKPAQLSGGQRQRVALGRAMVRKPRGFLLDEPLSNLDAQLRVQTRAELTRMHRRSGTTMLYVTHDQEEAMTLGDRVAVLRDGVLQQLAPPMEIYRRPVNPFVATFIGSPAMNLLPCICKNAEGGVRLVSPFFTIALQDSLEEVACQGEVLLGIRPQDVKVAGEKEADATARVDVIQPLGSEMVVHLNLLGGGESERVTLVVSADTPLQVGERIRLRLERERIHLFDAKDGRRVNRGQGEPPGLPGRLAKPFGKPR